MVFNVRFERQYFLSFQNMQDFDAFLFILLEGGVKSCLFLFWVCGRCMCTFHTFVEMCAQVFKPQKVSPCESMQPVFLQYNYNIKEDVIEFYCKESHLDEDKV